MDLNINTLSFKRNNNFIIKSKLGTFFIKRNNIGFMVKYSCFDSTSYFISINKINKILKLIKEGYDSDEKLDLLYHSKFPHKILPALLPGNIDPLKVESNVMICVDIYHKIISGLIGLIMLNFNILYKNNKLSSYLNIFDINYIKKGYSNLDDALKVMFNEKGFSIIKKFCNNVSKKYDKINNDEYKAAAIYIKGCDIILNKTKTWKKIPNWCMQFDTTENEIVWLE
jgi:hypothetical protein